MKEFSFDGVPVAEVVLEVYFYGVEEGGYFFCFLRFYDEVFSVADNYYVLCLF